MNVEQYIGNAIKSVDVNSDKQGLVHLKNGKTLVFPNVTGYLNPKKIQKDYLEGAIIQDIEFSKNNVCRFYTTRGEFVFISDEAFLILEESELSKIKVEEFKINGDFGHEFVNVQGITKGSSAIVLTCKENHLKNIDFRVEGVGGDFVITKSHVSTTGLTLIQEYKYDVLRVRVAYHNEKEARISIILGYTGMQEEIYLMFDVDLIVAESIKITKTAQV